MLVREVPIPKRRSITMWLAWLAVAFVVVVTAVPAFMDHGTRCWRPEEVFQLNTIGKNAKTYFIEKGTFPIGRSQTLPAWSCCPGQCGAVPARVWAADPIWAALDYSIDEATQVHYTYESFDGTTFRATAVRDMHCSGARRVFVLEGSSSNGNPSVTLTEFTPKRDR